ncbi:MAG: argininosuccinate lyase [Firmicutes bacterium]|nr:argininosuccinate lyase [Bacillota bacterium]
MKLWGGRFRKETDTLVDDFNESISIDGCMYQEDIRGSKAHARMLGDCGIISKEDSEKIIVGLEEIRQDVEAGKIEFTKENEDVHMNIESILTQRIGDAGKRLHTARSRNDQCAVDTRLFIRREIGEVIEETLEFLQVLKDLAAQHQKTVMPGYTHLQRAQPISFAQHLLAYAAMFQRDVTRLEECRERMNYSPLGSCALAGTTYPIDRWQTAKELEFKAPCSNTMDGVSDRDYLIELLSDLSIEIMHLSRFSEEVILWTSSEFKFVELDDGYSTGSSIMPQKKNSDVAELIRGKTGRVYGDLMAMLTVMKGIPLAYNKDMQEDKEPVIDALTTVKMCLPVFAGMLRTMKPLPENMRRAANEGFINATDCADYLTKRGVPFRDAYKTVGNLVHYCLEIGKTLEELSLEELKQIHPLFGEDVYEALDITNCMELRSSYGGPAVSETSRQISELERFLAERGW